MKLLKRFAWGLLVVASTILPYLPAQTVTVTAAHLGGTTPVTGSITFQPVLADGTTQASVRLGAAGGISSRQPLTAPVTAGAFTLTNVTDTSASSPQNPCYSVTAHTANGLQVLGPGLSCVQPAANNAWCTAGVCNFDAYPVSLPALAPVSLGFRWKGAFSSTGIYNVGDVVSYNGADYVAILATGAGAGSGSANAVVGSNVFNAAAATSGTAIKYVDGTAPALTGFTAAPLMDVTGAAQYISNGKVGYYTVSGYGPAFYDASGNYLAGDNSQGANDTTAGTVHTIPAGARKMRLYFEDGIQPVPYSGLMVIIGNTLPSSYQAYSAPNAGAVAPLPTDTSHWSVFLPAPASGPGLSQTQVTATVGTGAGNIVTLSQPTLGNRFDPTRAVAGSIVDGTSGALTSGYTGWVSTNFIYVGDIAGTGVALLSNATMYTYGNYTNACYDATLTYTGEVVHGGINAGTGITIPAGCVFFRGYFDTNNSAQGGAGNAPVTGISTASVMFYAGALSASYKGFGPASTLPVSPWAGKNMCEIGDSISTENFPTNPHIRWEATAAQILGANLYFESWWAGRSLSHAFDNSGNTGQTAPSSAALAGCDVIVLFLGTNMDVLNASGVGTATDAPALGSTATFGAELQYVLNQLDSWNPNARKIWVTPYLSNRYNANGIAAGNLPDSNSTSILQSIVSVGKQIAESRGTPVIDLWGTSGINPITIPTLLPFDYLHPSQATSSTLLAPLIARGMSLYPQQ